MAAASRCSKTSHLRTLKEFRKSKMQASAPDNKTGSIFHFLVPAYCQGPVGGLGSMP